MAESSNDWIKPNDIMRYRKYKSLKKSISSNISSTPSTMVSRNANVTQSQTPDPIANRTLKRKNPFSCESQYGKIQALEGKSIADQPDLPNSRISKIGDNFDKERAFEASFSAYLERVVKEGEEAESEAIKKSKTKEVSNTGTFLPEDWSLRTKMKFFVPTSSVEKFWPIRGTDEAQGIADFIRKTENKDLKQVLQNHLMYWSYPNLPWLKLFPRMDAGKQKVDLNGVTILNKNAENSLFNEWLGAISSCYQNIRQDLCLYMFVCCQHMTILFISASASGNGEVITLVTPTTRGLRKSLDDEGIDYQLPLVTRKTRKISEDSAYEKSGTSCSDEMNNESNKSTTDKEVSGCDKNPHSINKDEKLGDDDDDDDEDDEEWLEKLGLDKKHYQSRDTSISAKNNSSEVDDDFRMIDYRPTSTVLMQGVNSNAFFNFFVNSSHVLSTVGPLAGIPPTILSPFAFKNSSLRSVNICETGELVNNLEYLIAIKNADDKRTLLEISGPILPHAFKNICQFFGSNCDVYSGLFTVLESSVPFNCFGAEKQVNEEAGITENHGDKIMRLRNSAVRSVEFGDSLFKWNDKK